jgi:RES domain-containing protein
MLAYRVTRERYMHLDGEGARKAGGRWNSPGFAMVYLSDSLALAVLEFRVNQPSPALPIPDLVYLELELPDRRVQEVKRSELGKDWSYSSDRLPTQIIGNRFIKEDYAHVLKVPTAILPVGHNLLMNPNSGFIHIVTIKTVENLMIDSRLYEAKLPG